jgi:hypothetical protein
MGTETVNRWNTMIEGSDVDLHGKHAVEWLGADPKLKDFTRKRNIVKIVVLSKVNDMSLAQTQDNLKQYLGESVPLEQIEDMLTKFSQTYPHLWS